LSGPIRVRLWVCRFRNLADGRIRFVVVSAGQSIPHVVQGILGGVGAEDRLDDCLQIHSYSVPACQR
jgi:hypothetical protein